MTHYLQSNPPLQLQSVEIIPLVVVILASQPELAVRNPLHKVYHVPRDQSCGILNNLCSDADMTLRDSFNGLLIKVSRYFCEAIYPKPRVVGGPR